MEHFHKAPKWWMRGSNPGDFSFAKAAGPGGAFVREEVEKLTSFPRMIIHFCQSIHSAK